MTEHTSVPMIWRITSAPFIAAWAVIYGIGYIPTIVILYVLIGIMAFAYMISGLLLTVIAPFQVLRWVADGVGGWADTWPTLLRLAAGVGAALVTFLFGIGVWLGMGKAALKVVKAVGELAETETLQNVADLDDVNPVTLWRGSVLGRDV